VNYQTLAVNNTGIDFQNNTNPYWGLWWDQDIGLFGLFLPLKPLGPYVLMAMNPTTAKLSVITLLNVSLAEVGLSTTYDSIHKRVFVIYATKEGVAMRIIDISVHPPVSTTVTLDAPAWNIQYDPVTDSLVGVLQYYMVGTVNITSGVVTIRSTTWLPDDGPPISQPSGGCLLDPVGRIFYAPAFANPLDDTPNQWNVVDMSKPKWTITNNNLVNALFLPVFVPST